MGIEFILASTKSTLLFLVFLGILVAVHEWGHFITAKKLGVDVERFALGFGPTLYSQTYNGTLYMLNLIPLGGYVKMSGDERSQCKGDPGEYYSKPVGYRALIVFNGPLVNYVLAYLCLALVFAIGYPGLSTRVTALEQNGPAAIAGIKANDKIVKINGESVYGYQQMMSLLQGDDISSVDVTVQRDGREVVASVVPNIIQQPDLLGKVQSYRDLGVKHYSNKIGGLSAGYPAVEAGIEVNDEILTIDDKVIEGWSDIQQAVSESTGSTIEFKLRRDGNIFTRELKPIIDTIETDEGTEEVRRVGISPLTEFDTYKFSIIESSVLAFQELWRITVLTYKAVYSMVTGSMSAKETVGGPVLIFGLVTAAAEEGLAHWFFILGVVSASLAIFNLLPLIPLDGGHLMFQAIEKLRGKPFSAKVDDYIARIGFAFIIMLALYIFYIDFDRIGLFSKIQSLWIKLVGLFVK